MYKRQGYGIAGGSGDGIVHAGGSNGIPMVQADFSKGTYKAVSYTHLDVYKRQGDCIHRPGFTCTLPEEAKQSPGTGVDCSTNCCWDCVKHGDCRLECHASAGREGRIATSQRILEEVEQELAAETQQKEADCCENRSGELSAYGTPARICLLYTSRCV